MIVCVFLNNNIIRSRDYESLVELGARIGVKIRERDEGSVNKTKVCCTSNAYKGHQIEESIGTISRLHPKGW